MAHGSHDYAEDPRNERILISLDGELLPRPEAKVSVFDSGFILGDGVWEGLRLHRGKLVFLEAHLRRLYEGAKAIDLDIGMTPEELTAEIHRTIEANAMSDGVHVRLMITRGRKATPYQDPRITVGGPTIVIIPEYKAPAESTADDGIRLFTVHVGRGAPNVQDPKLNSHSKLNCILACIQATKAGADEALMLDPNGFVATCNSTHFFVVRDGEVWTSTGDWCLGGITRGKILQVCREDGIPAFEKNFSPTEVHGADEAFVTGTFAGVVPVTEIDGRTIGDPTRVRPGTSRRETGTTDGAAGPITRRLRDLYRDLIERECGS